HVSSPCHSLFFFFFPTRPPPSSTLFPYTTLFRSHLLIQYIVDHASDLGKHLDQCFTLVPDGTNSSLYRKVQDMIAKVKADEARRSEEHTSELQSRFDLVCRLLLEKKKKTKKTISR